MPQMNDFVIKFVKIGLAMYYASERVRKPRDKIYPSYNSK